MQTRSIGKFLLTTFLLLQLAVPKAFSQTNYNDGPGGPILVIGSSSNPFSFFTAEMLRSEGWNEFKVLDISTVTASTLTSYDVVVLGDIPLTAAQVTMLSDWTNAGGTLVAFAPDAQLAPLMGLTSTGGTLSDKYLLVNTASSPGQGIVGQTIQFHGPADLYTANAGTNVVATLYSTATTATSNPAVTVRNVGTSGGQAIAFTYDLAKSIVYTRQGNPAWAGQKRDGQAGPIRSDDIFFPDWVDFTKVAIPQADEQMRLLSNIIVAGNADKKPLPRFWFLPKGKTAAVVMTGDDHAILANSTANRFDQYVAATTTNTAQDVLDWNAVRATSYLFVGSSMTDANVVKYQNLGFELGLHMNTNCSDFTATTWNSFWSSQWSTIKAQLPSLANQVTHRTHCIAFSDWATTPKVEKALGIRFDVNYYYWPGAWVNDRPGMFTGSGMPMRFADLDGTMIDAYQAATQMTDESGQTYPKNITALLDSANGAPGYYGVFVANMHTDIYPHAGSDAIVSAALARQVPVVSAKQMLDWVDGRNSSAFSGISWNANTLTFTVTQDSRARNMKGMLPTSTATAALSGITLNGVSVTFTKKTIKGVEYAFFDASSGIYVATYGADVTPPAISAITATAKNDGTATITWTTNEASDSRVDYGTASGTLNLNASNATGVTTHTLSLTGLTNNTTYYFRVTSKDAAGNSATSPASPAAPLTFTVPVRDTTAPVISSVTATPNINGTAVISWTTDEVSDSRVDFGTTSTSLTSNLSDTTKVTTHTLSLTGLTNNTTYYFRVTSKDPSANSTTSPIAANSPLNFLVPAKDTIAPVISAILVTPNANGTAVVTWTTNEASTSRIDYGTASGSLTLNVSDTTKVTSHTLNLTGLTQSTTYYYRVTSADASANSATSPTAANSPLSFTVPAPVCPCNVFTGTPTLGGPYNDGQALVVGMKFRVTANGYITGVRFYKQTGNTGTHIGLLYSSTGTVLGQATFTGETASGWQTVTFATPVSVVPNTTYVAAYHSSAGNYSATANVFATAQVNGSLRGLADGEDGVNGVYKYSATPTLPTSGYQKSSYGVDVVYTGADVTPPVITSIVSTPKANGTATITWTTDESSDSRVDYGTTSTSLASNVSSTTMGTAHTLSLTGLTQGTTYYFRVTSKDASANSATSPLATASPLSFTVPDTIPPVITAVTATAGTTSGTMTITWTTNENSDSRIDYGTTSSTLTLNQSNATRLTAHSMTLTGLVPLQTYYFRVTSKDSTGNSATSPIAANSPLSFVVPDLTAPVITNVTAKAYGNGTATITWTTDENSDTRVDYGTTSANLASNQSNATRLTAHSLTLTGLVPLQTYYYRVTSKDSSLNSTTSPLAANSPLSFVIPDTIAPVISNITVTPGQISGTMTVSWTTDENSDTRVDYGTTSANLALNLSNATRLTAHSVTFTGLVPLQTYYFRVTSKDSTGNSITSPIAANSPLSFVAPDLTAPVISNVTAKAYGNGTATITWTTDENSDTRVDYGTTSANLASNQSNATRLTSHSLTLTGLVPLQTYYYRVTSKDSSLNSTTSPLAANSPLSFVIPDTIAPVISSITTTAGQTSGTMTVSWTTDEVSDSRVDYGLNSGSLNLNQSSATRLTGHNIVLTGLTPGLTYYFRVTSKDSSANSATAPVSPLSFKVPDVIPPVITNIVSTPNGNGTAQIAWTTDEPSDSRVDYGTNSSTLGLSLSDPATSTSHLLTISGLVQGQTYYFRVSSRDTAANSATSPASPASPMSFSIPDNTPPVITNVNATPGAAGSMVISWTTNENSDSRVDFGTAAASLTSNQSNATRVTAHSLTLTGLVQGQTYYFRVNSKDSSLNGATSPDALLDPLSFTVPDLTAPVITGIVATPNGNGTAVITWTTNEISDSRVDYGSSSGSLGLNISDPTFTTTHSLTINGLVQGQTYYFRVSSRDTAANSATSPASPASPMNFSIPDITPPVITNVNATPGAAGSMVISWTTNENSDSRVDFGTAAASLTSNQSNATRVTAHSLTLTGLVQGQTYYFRVNSKDSSLNGATSPDALLDPLSFTVPDLTAPVITGIVATPNGNGTAVITWTTNEISDSRVDYGSSSGSLGLNVSDPTFTTTHSLTINGLVQGQTYYFRVNSKDTVANSATSPASPASPMSFSIPDITPPVITNVNAIPGAASGTMVISWTTNENSDSRVDFGGNAANLGTNQSNATRVTVHSMTLTGLTVGNTYYYRVSSRDSSLNGATSPDLALDPLSFTVPDVTAPVITGIVATPNGNGTAVITWTTDELSDSRVDYGVSSGTLGSNLTDAVPTTAHSLTITGLVQGQTYYFRVGSKDAALNASTAPALPAAALSFTIPDITPPVISNIVATPGANGTAVITWTTDEASDSRVDFGTTSATLGSNQSSATRVLAHSITLTGLAQGQTYYFRVSSKDSSANSLTSPDAASNPLTFSMPADVTPPVITVVTATPGTNGTAVITWTTNESSDSRVDYGTSSGTLNLNTSNTTMVTAHSITLTGLTQGVTYYFRVSSADAFANSATSPASPAAPQTFTMPDVTAPVITVIAVTPNVNGTALVTWTTDEASDSRVDYGTASGTLNLNASNATMVTAHSITLSGLTSGATYYFRVTSKDASANSATAPASPAAPQNFTMPDFAAPVITSIVATPNGNGTAVITWTTDEASNSRIDYGTASGTLNLNASNATMVTAHSITISGLSQGVTYYFRVTSADASANSATSPTAANSPSSFTVPDITPPVISTVVATVASSGGTATITWTTNEASDTRVDYGTASGTLNLNASNATLVTAHSITLSGLTSGTTYYYRVTSKDASNNSATSPVAANAPATFTMPAALVSVCGTDDTNTQFSSGTLGTALASVLDSNGALILKPTLSEDFTATTTPTGWVAGNWQSTGASTTYSAGAVTVNGSHVYTSATYAAGASLEFYAKFTTKDFQNVGFSGSASFGTPWVAIGRGAVGTGAGLYVRTSSGVNTLLSSTLLNAYHRYKIMWNSTNFTIWVDGVQVATATQTITTAMNVQISDFNTGTSNLAVDWVRVSPYVTTGTFTSRVIDAGSTTFWKSASWNQLLPTGTSIAISYRTGNTATPDGTWSAWNTATNGGAISGNTRYLQYQAVLTTTVTASTPVLKDISFSCSASPTVIKMKGSPIVDQTVPFKTWSFDLGQNHPNPANGFTVIPYEIATATKVRITVWDMYGRLVKVAEEGDREPGRYTLQVNVNGLSKGIYIYRMQAGDYTATRKMVIE